jgi:hypothetical protein
LHAAPRAAAARLYRAALEWSGVPGKGSYPPGGPGLLVPLTDAQFEAALESRAVDLPPFLVPEGTPFAFLGVLRARHAGMLTHWADVRAIEPREGEPPRVRLRLGSLNRFPRPIEWREHREVYRPVHVEADALRRASSLDDIVDIGAQAAAAAIVQAASFIELERPKLDLSAVSRKSLLDRAASFAAKDPARALDQIDMAVTEMLRDLTESLYGESADEDAGRDGWFGADSETPTVESYLALLKEADDPDLARLIPIAEHYVAVRRRALALESGHSATQVADLIAVAQALFDAATGR